MMEPRMMSKKPANGNKTGAVALPGTPKQKARTRRAFCFDSMEARLGIEPGYTALQAAA